LSFKGFYATIASIYNLARKKMAHKISDACVSCGSCVSDCPVDAISEKDGTYVIDAAACTDCGACVGSCPTDAISA